MLDFCTVSKVPLPIIFLNYIHRAQVPAGQGSHLIESLARGGILFASFKKKRAEWVYVYK